MIQGIASLINGILTILPMTARLAPKKGTKTVIVSFHVPKVVLEALDRLVEAGLFNNRSEAIRMALFNLLREMWREHPDLRSKLEVGYR